MTKQVLSKTFNLPTHLGDFEPGQGELFLLAGPDIFEDAGMVMEVATELKRVTTELQIPWIFKCSFDKANRQSAQSFRGPGMESALKGLEKVKGELGITLVTDVHESTQMDRVAAVADVIQIPAFLCRQTDLLQSAAKTGKVLNIKKGQFMAPWDMGSVLDKARDAGSDKLMLCERGVSFGYNRLVVDMTSLPSMRDFGVPVVMDATHSVQLPGGKGNASDGRREMIAVLARAAAAVGVDGFFLETHPNPERALCDGPNSLHLKDVRPLLQKLKAINSALISGN